MKLTHKTNAYATHQPVLIAALKQMRSITKEWENITVLEIGCGSGSTPLLRFLSPDVLVTVDSDIDWIAQMKELAPASDKHEYIHLGFDDILKSERLKKKWNIVFLDQGSWNSRSECLEFFADKASFIVVHDSDPYSDFVSKNFKYSKEFYIHPNTAPLMPIYPNGMAGPPTIVCSNFFDCSNIEPDFTIDEA